MALCQVCVSRYGKGVVNRENVFSISGGHVGPGQGTSHFICCYTSFQQYFSLTCCLLKKKIKKINNQNQKNTMLKELVLPSVLPTLQRTGSSRASVYWDWAMPFRYTSVSFSWNVLDGKSSRLGTRSSVDVLCNCGQVSFPLWASS